MTRVRAEAVLNTRIAAEKINNAIDTLDNKNDNFNFACCDTLEVYRKRKQHGQNINYD